MRRVIPLNPDLALLFLRVVLGCLMIYHGWPKLTDVGGTIGGFTGMGIPLAPVAAVYATFVETLGGLLMVLGAFSDVVGVLFAIDMLGAITLVHAKNGLAVNEGGFEFVLALMAMALTIAFVGPGRFSVSGRGERPA